MRAIAGEQARRPARRSAALFLRCWRAGGRVESVGRASERSQVGRAPGSGRGAAPRRDRIPQRGTTMIERLIEQKHWLEAQLPFRRLGVRQDAEYSDVLAK